MYYYSQNTNTSFTLKWCWCRASFGLVLAQSFRLHTKKAVNLSAGNPVVLY